MKWTDIYGGHWKFDGNKVMEEKAMKFKVGDKVRIKNLAAFSQDYKVGDVGVVVEADNREYTLKMSNGITQFCDDGDIEPAKDKAMKFKVGDKVRIKSKAEIAKAYGDVDDMPGCWVDVMDKYCGKTGKIISISNDRYRVDFGLREWTYGEKALMPAQSAVTITFNGDTTIATDGEHTATVTRYHGDEYSEETGAIEAIKKLYHRFPQKGDVVYFVGVSRDGAYVGSCRFDGTFAVDRSYRKSGNLYETKAAAQKVADKINAIFADERK